MPDNQRSFVYECAKKCGMMLVVLSDDPGPYIDTDEAHEEPWSNAAFTSFCQRRFFLVGEASG